MRGKRAFKNIITNIIVQLTLAVSGLIVPKLIMNYYGSEINGLVSSISQFITYAALIELGIGNSSIIALYKPLAEENYEEISDIVSSSKKMYLISAYVYTAIVIVIASLYPQLYTNKLNFWFVFDLVLCVGAVNAIDYFILGKYKILLIADQKYYILNIVKIIATVILTVISILLLVNGYSILWTKSVAIVTHLGEALFIYIYIQNKYSKVNYKSKKIRKIKQRWNALIHQLCSTITYNTDLVVLTLCLPEHSLLEISVYSVYAIVLSFLTNIIGTLTTGINASFGNMMAKNEHDLIKKVFDYYEYFYFIILFVLYSSFAVLVLPFVSCYTREMDDVNYIRTIVGLLFALNGLTAQLKEVAGVIINASGKYKETQRYAVEEAISNIIISLILVKPLGIVGVLIGTLVSHIWMDFRFIYYMECNLILGIGKTTIQRIVRNTTIYILLVSIEISVLSITSAWLYWFIQAFTITIINTFVILGLNVLCEKDKILYVIQQFTALIKK